MIVYRKQTLGNSTSSERKDSKWAFVTCKESTALRINEARHKKKVTDPEQDKTKCDESEDEESLAEQALVQTRTDIYPHAGFLLSPFHPVLSYPSSRTQIQLCKLQHRHLHCHPEAAFPVSEEAPHGPRQPQTSRWNNLIVPHAADGRRAARTKRLPGQTRAC